MLFPEKISNNHLHDVHQIAQINSVFFWKKKLFTIVIIQISGEKKHL